MLFFIIFIAIVVLLVKETSGFWDFFGKLIFLNFISFAILYAACVFFATLSYPFSPKKVEREWCEIVSLGSQSQINGNFTLGSGYIDSERCYFFYQKLSDGSMIERKYRSDNTFIVESNGEPKFTWNKVTTEFKWTWCFLLFFDFSEVTYDGWTLHIPKNSVIKEFHPN